MRGVIPMEIIGNQWQPLQKLGIAIAAKAALSVWGKPDILKLTWEGTGLGFSNIAGARRYRPIKCV